MTNREKIMWVLLAIIVLLPFVLGPLVGGYGPVEMVAWPILLIAWLVAYLFWARRARNVS